MIRSFGYLLSGLFIVASTASAQTRWIPQGMFDAIQSGVGSGAGPAQKPANATPPRPYAGLPKPPKPLVGEHELPPVGFPRPPKPLLGDSGIPTVGFPRPPKDADILNDLQRFEPLNGGRAADFTKKVVTCELSRSGLVAGQEEKFVGFCKLNGARTIDLPLNAENVAYLSELQIYAEAQMCTNGKANLDKARLAFKKALVAKLSKLCKKTALATPSFAASANDVIVDLDALATLDTKLPLDCRERSAITTH